MAQLNWVFLDDFGGRHRVGLYHGDRTGHVMIHCNMKVMQIDFSVKESKMYSFFIEDELIEIILEKKNGVFGYEFRVNKKVDTPRNRERRVQEGRNRKYMTMLAGGILLILAVAFFGLKWFGREQEAKRMNSTSIVGKYSRQNMQLLAADGKATTARLHLLPASGDAKTRIGFMLMAVDSTHDHGNFEIADRQSILLPNGFPFADGDEFMAIYLPSDPQVFRVDFFQPERSTVSRYITLALGVEKKTHPGDDDKKCLCRVLSTAERLGWNSLAYFIYQGLAPQENARYNQQTYAQLMHDPGLMQMFQERCWDQ